VKKHLVLLLVLIVALTLSADNLDWSKIFNNSLKFRISEIMSDEDVVPMARNKAAQLYNGFSKYTFDDSVFVRNAWRRLREIEEESEKWEIIGSGGDNIFFVLSENMRFTDQHIIQFWLCTGYGNDGRKERIEAIKRDGDYTKCWDNLGYSLELEQVNVRTKQYRTITSAYYTHEGRALSYRNQRSGIISFTHIFPGSVGEAIFNFVTENAKR